MRILNRNKNILYRDKGYNITGGIEFILKRASNNGINNTFLDANLTDKLAEIDKNFSLKIQPDMDLLWTEVYSLSITNRRAMAFVYDQSFLNFIFLEKYFISNKNLNGGIVLFLFKKPGINKFSLSFESIFPTYNYHKISGFIDHLPYYFELSEKLKLPVLIYLNDSIINEYNIEEEKEYTERTASKPNFSLMDNGKETVSYELRNNIQFFKNTGKYIELFKGKTQNNLILTDAEYFNKIIENKNLSDNSDIILFNLINPVDSIGFIELIRSDGGNNYENIFIFDSKGLLGQSVKDILEDDKTLLTYKNIKFIGADNNKAIEFGFCTDDFVITEIKSPKSFCAGCTLFTFLQGLEKKPEASEDSILIGGEGCFSLLNSSALRFSFQNIMLTENPLFLSFNLYSKDLNKNLYIFIPSLRFSEQIDKFNKISNELNLNHKIVFVVYKSIHDFDYAIKTLFSHPLLKSFKKMIVKKATRLKDLNIKNSANLIFIDNDCNNIAQSGRNLNYTSYLYINNSICEKFECRLCYQKTRCTAIKITDNKNIFIDAEICNFCKLCIDICPNKAIKSKKRKKIKFKKSLESRINL